jgi:hypothetical protein
MTHTTDEKGRLMAIEKTEHIAPDNYRRNINSDTDFHSASNQWIIDVKCPFYEEFLKLFEKEYKGEDESKIKTTFRGYQYDVTPKNLAEWGGEVVRSDKMNPDTPEQVGFPSSHTINETQFDVNKANPGSNFPPIDKNKFDNLNWDQLVNWVMKQIKRNKIPVKNIKVSKCWCVDYNDGGYQAIHNHGPGCISMVMAMDSQPSTGDNTQSADNGMLYTLMPNPDGTQLMTQFGPYPGRTVILDGRVWHGVYPAKAPRRTFVVDFDFEYYAPDEEIPGMVYKIDPDKERLA